MLRGSNAVVDGMVEWTLDNVTGNETAGEKARLIEAMKTKHAELLTANPAITRNGRMIKEARTVSAERQPHQDAD